MDDFIGVYFQIVTVIILYMKFIDLIMLFYVEIKKCKEEK